MSEQGPRYATIGDYLRVLRRRRVLAGLIVLICTLSSLGYALSQEKEYTAQAQISFRDPLRDLTLIGQGSQVFSDISPGQRAAIQADQITSSETARKVKRSLDADTKAKRLAGAVSTEVDVQTNVVTVEATWGDAEFAADLANAFTQEGRKLAIEEARNTLEAAEDALRGDLREASRQRPLPGIRISIIEANLQRVRGLLAISDPVDILEDAVAPGAASSPQVERSTALGAVLGLILAIIAAFVRDSLDRRLHNAHEIHEELGLPVLGRIGASAFNYSGLVKTGGPVMTETDFESFRVLRMNLAHLSGDKTRPLTSVVVTSPLPQEGKSTVSISLASASALAGQRTLLVECDLRRPSLTRRLGVAREPGLTDFLKGDATPSEILQVVEVTTPLTFVNGQKPSDQAQADSAERLVVISAGSPVSNAPELLQSERFENFLNKVSRAYDLVVLDGSPLLSVADPLELAADANCVLLCVRVQQTTRDQARAARAALSHLPEQPSGVVVTGLKRGDETYEYYYGY